MKIACRCGALIPDSSDGLPHKAHLVPDGAWHPLLDRIDAEVIDALAVGHINADRAAMTARTLLIEAIRSAYECASCGRLYVTDSQGTLQPYAPEGPARSVLRGT